MATSADGTDPLAAGYEALRNAAWDDARVRFEEAAGSSETPEVWEGLSRAAWWQGDQERTLTAREHAYRAYRKAGNARSAAGMAMWLASDHRDFRGDEAVASAWLRTGLELLRDHEPCSELGYLTLLDADMALVTRSDPSTAERLAREALALARDIGDFGVEVVALALLGSALVSSGAVGEGLQRLEECAALAVGEQFMESAAPGWALCHTVAVCANVGDFGRASQWCQELHTWSALWHGRHFFGICRTAYGDVLTTTGDWSSAEQELLSAMDDLRMTRPALAGPTLIRLGRLRVRQGHLAEARSLFESALPMPPAIIALGELALAAGDPVAGLDAADRVLRRLGKTSALDRFPALELLARARAAAGDAAGADMATTELESEAVRLATGYMRGRARLVRARVLSAAGAHDGARQAAEDAIDLFIECSAPYEAADARLVLASAFESLDRHGRAEEEGLAARAAFEALNAGTAGHRLKAVLLTAREADILRLVARGLGDAQVAERLFLSPHTVHRHIANIRTKLDVPSRAAAVACAIREGLL